MALGNRYKCMHCGATFRGSFEIGCPMCRSNDIKVIERGVRID
jgi:DNA-directed RNA polymerase subunit RPC12/RpoP